MASNTLFGVERSFSKHLSLPFEGTLNTTSEVKKSRVETIINHIIQWPYDFRESDSIVDLWVLECREVSYITELVVVK